MGYTGEALKLITKGIDWFEEAEKKELADETIEYIREYPSKLTRIITELNGNKYKHYHGDKW